MDEIINRESTEIAVLGSLAREARMYSEAAALNMLQLGRVLTEAKELVRHGGWQDWVRENAHMSETQAQYLMRAYSRFGMMPCIEGVEKSKIFKMLSLPSGTEEAFLQDNDVQHMSAREVEAAVKRAKEEVQSRFDAEKRKIRNEADAEINAAKDAQRAAEAREQELKNKAPEIPEDVSQQLKQLQSEVQNIKEERDGIIARKNREICELEDQLASQQEALERAQDDLYNAQSAIARGDAERNVSDRLTAEDFGRAVKQFIGSTARLPYMGSTFATMTSTERNEFDENLRAIEGWVKSARRAVETLEGVILNG